MRLQTISIAGLIPVFKKPAGGVPRAFDTSHASKPPPVSGQKSAPGKFAAFLKSVFRGRVGEQVAPTIGSTDGKEPEAVGEVKNNGTASALARRNARKKSDILEKNFRKVVDFCAQEWRPEASPLMLSVLRMASLKMTDLARQNALHAQELHGNPRPSPQRVESLLKTLKNNASEAKRLLRLEHEVLVRFGDKWALDADALADPPTRQVFTMVCNMTKAKRDMFLRDGQPGIAEAYSRNFSTMARLDFSVRLDELTNSEKPDPAKAHQLLNDVFAFFHDRWAPDAVPLFLSAMTVANELAMRADKLRDNQEYKESRGDLLKGIIESARESSMTADAFYGYGRQMLLLLGKCTMADDWRQDIAAANALFNLSVDMSKRQGDLCMKFGQRDDARAVYAGLLATMDKSTLDETGISLRQSISARLATFTRPQ